MSASVNAKLPETPTTPSDGAIHLKGPCSYCDTPNHRLLHRLHLRGSLHRLCTSCVLRLHPSSFCPFCFHFYDRPIPISSIATPSTPPSPAAFSLFVSCRKCSAFAHVRCLPYPIPAPSFFLCPPCCFPNFSFFDIPKSDNTPPVLHKKLAVTLLCAAQIASASMNKAAAVARANADMCVREAALSRKKAEEALGHFYALRVQSPVKVSVKSGATDKSGEDDGSGNPGDF